MASMKNITAQKKLTFKIADAEKQLGRAKSIFVPKQHESQVINKVYHNPTTTLLQNDGEGNIQHHYKTIQLQQSDDALQSNSLSPIAKSNLNSGQSNLPFSSQNSPHQSIQELTSQPNINEMNNNHSNKTKLLQSNTNRTQVQLETQLLSNNVIEIVDCEEEILSQIKFNNRKLQENTSNNGLMKSLINKSHLTNEEFGLSSIQNYGITQLLSTRYQFYIEKGNSSNILETLLLKRGNWDQNLDPNAQGIKFKWFQSLRGILFDQVIAKDEGNQLQLINHFQFQKALGDKIQLYTNLEQYCKENSLPLNQIMPLQFSINMSSPEFGCIISDILKQFKQQQWKLPSEKIIEKTFQTKLANGKHKVQKLSQDTQWILKVSNLDSLKGVQLIEDYGQFTDILQYKIGKEEQISEYRVDSNGDVDQRNYSCFLRSEEFVLQQYLTNPLLVDDKKVQIGALFLITNANAYLCKESLVRVADRNYVAPEDGIIANTSSPFPSSYLREKVKDKIDFNLLLQKIKEKCLITYKAVKDKLNKAKIQFCMEIFEFEFFVNALGECFLIEVNTNLKWMATNNYLRKLNPNILNEALKLTLDPLFPPSVEVSSEYENIWSLID